MLSVSSFGGLVLYAVRISAHGHVKGLLKFFVLLFTKPFFKINK